MKPATDEKVMKMKSWAADGEFGIFDEDVLELIARVEFEVEERKSLLQAIMRRPMGKKWDSPEFIAWFDEVTALAAEGGRG